MSKYFKPLEFKACVPSCNIEDMNVSFLRYLDTLRELCGFPLVLNCAYRTPAWDISKGRSGKSYHTKGLAVDIRCYDPFKRAQIVRHAIAIGLSVGVYSSFIHVDARFLDGDITQEPVCFYGISYGTVSASDLDKSR